MTALELSQMLDSVDWSQYETAYGNAAQDIPHFQVGKTPSVPRSLGELFSGDRERAMRAASNLWAGLCHQHAYISSAALPACDFLILALQEADDELKVELLDIFLGFAACTGRSAETDWEKQLRDKLTSHLPVFAELVSSENEDISYFSERIVEELTGEKG